MGNDLDYDEELARWLAESGRRRALSMKDVENELSAPVATAATRASSGEGVVVRRLVLLGVLALSALQYVFADTQLRIAQLPTLIVFAGDK
jgi:hypothetical protein